MRYDGCCLPKVKESYHFFTVLFRVTTDIHFVLLFESMNILYWYSFHAKVASDVSKLLI
jgi:hypothetical protein